MWWTDFNVASDLGNRTGQPMLLLFTGSDWCEWCIILEKNVLRDPTVIEWIKSNVIPVKIDFPHESIGIEQKKINERLKKGFGVSGFPTPLLVKVVDKKFSIIGEIEDVLTPISFIENAERLINVS